MATDARLWRRARRSLLVVGVALSLLAGSAPLSLASAVEEQQGAQLLQSFQAGKTSCKQLSRDQFELIGESVMGRMLGSTAAHEAMNRQMTRMVGSAGEVQAHTFMGQRFTGCASGAAPAAFGSMMGMMGGYAGAGGSKTGRGQSGTGYGGGMMGGSSSRGTHDSGGSGSNTVMVILIGVLLVALLGALVVLRPSRRPPVKTPLDLLSERYAGGEIDGEEYARRRQALED